MSVLQSRVLLLNGSTWEPLSVITVQRAINLLLGGKAIAVEMTGQYLHTVRTRFEVPSVVALKSYVNVPRRKSHWSRKGVLVRDDYTCVYCGIKLGAQLKGKVLSKRDFTIDHIIPAARAAKTPGRTPPAPAPNATTARATGCTTSPACACSGSRRPREPAIWSSRWARVPRFGSATSRFSLA